MLSWLRRRPTWHPRLTSQRLAAALTLVLIAIAIAPTSSSGATYQVPSTIAADCSVDVTQSLLTWIASVPNGSTLAFGSGRCYRIEGTLEIRGRSGLTFDGSGATFRSFNAPADQRALWRVVDSTTLAFRNMTLQGSYTRGGTFTYDLQHAHAIDLRGTGAEVANLKISDFAGDCVYFGLGYSSALNRSSGSVHDSSCVGTGRNGVAVSAGNDIRVERNTLDRIGYIVFDVEPNIGPGWGAQRVTFDNNTIGNYYLYAYAVVENAPITDQAFTNNRVLGRGLRIGIVHPGASYRPANITISGNSSDTAQWSPAMEMQKVDGLIVTNNTVPMSGGAMAWVEESCAVNLAGNNYPGGTSQMKMSPWVCSLSPTSGLVGASVTVGGSGFTGATAVSVNGSAASFTVNSGSQITLTVPSGATSGPIRVTTPAGTATSPSSFAVTAAPAAPAAPVISSFTPTSGLVGASVTVGGSGFTGATAVSVNGSAASFTVNSGSQITLTVPSGATSGPIRVTTPAGTATSPSSFAVTAAPAAPAAPVISSFTPTSGLVGASVTVGGSGFTGATAVSVNGSAASFTVNSGSQITLTVPSGATSGPIRVTTPAGTATSPSSFAVTAAPAAPAAPVISSFTPTSGLVGASVTVGGSGFTGATAVSVNGSAASFTVNSGSQITLTVPSGATSGPIRVTTPGGTATSASAFTVTAAPAAPADKSAPSQPGGLTESRSTERSITLSWSASTDNVGVAGYGLYKDGTLVASPRETRATIDGLECGNSYTVAVDAYDAAGNRSGKATAIVPTDPCHPNKGKSGAPTSTAVSTSSAETAASPPADTAAPSQPGGFMLSRSTEKSITLSWSPSTDNVGVAGYGLYKDGTLVASPKETSATMDGLECGNSYTVAVDAYDAAGNRSGKATATVPTDPCHANKPDKGK